MSDRTPGKFARSWALFKASLVVLRQHPSLLLFPIITFVCTLVITGFFLTPAVFYPTGYSLNESEHWISLARMIGVYQDGVVEGPIRPEPVVYAYGALLYLVSMFIATFANTAFYHQIIQAFSGEAVSIRAGVAFALTRLRSILMWSLFAGVIGLIIKMLEERLGWVGALVMRFVGVVWSVASVFAIPVLIREGKANPIALLRSSAQTLRQTWGEALIGYLGVTFGGWIVAIGSVLFLGTLGVVSGVLQTPWPILSGVGVWLIAIIAYGFLMAMIGHIYRCALYIYATEGVVPAPYDAGMMDSAWKVKKA
ncbi:DUF6159 family protein [Actomonas aquatica]|uniref:DUF6159 family protein n=1 Tax=Actomonas aquatica TaxID=2866162 RepID=A0ABZ1C2N0_9BACT|nr:DUF6159 family protein [Opitutus sp. WL0086]WRQ85610.1 DUF6159 family protein [Opitutus sp. WL0086]